MANFFNVDNPVWRFIGNLADFFPLSIITTICCRRLAVGNNLPGPAIGAGPLLYFI